MAPASTGPAAAGAAGPDRILLLAALPREVRPFLRLSRARRRRGLPWPAWEFGLGRVRGLLAVSGMGQQAAGEAAVRLVGQFRPQLVVSLGFGGSLTSGLNPGDLVLGESFSRFDPTTRVLEPVNQTQKPPRPLPELLQPLIAAGLPAVAGSCITTPWIIHKDRQGGPLRSLSFPVLDLETAAVAEAAGSESIPFLSLRAITDTAGEEIPGFLVSEGEPDPAGPLEILGWLADDPRRLKDLVHLWRRSRLAASRLAQALMVLLPWLGTVDN